jgi:hypothetical protein
MAQQASAPHDARISGRDSVLRRQFLGKSVQTQCDTASAGCHEQIYAVVIEDVGTLARVVKSAREVWG